MWYADGFRKILLINGSPEWVERRGEAFDAARYVERLKDARVETVQFAAKDLAGLCYFRTSIGPSYPRDMLGEFIALAQPAGIKVMAFMSLEEDSYACRQHPEWAIVRQTGYPLTPTFMHPFGRACISSPYRDYFLGLVDEVARQYPIDGVWVDVVNVAYRNSELACYCDFCQTLYRQTFGRPLPLRPTFEELRAAHRWRIDAVRSVLEETYRIARSYRQDQVVAYLPGDLPTDPIRNADVTSVHNEAPEYLTRSYRVRHARSTGKPAEVTSPGSVRQPVIGLPHQRPEHDILGGNGWYGWDQKPQVVMHMEAALALAHGCSTVFGVTPYPDGSLEASQLDQIGEVFKAVEALEPYVSGANPVAQVALLLGAKAYDAPSLVRPLEESALGWNASLLTGQFLYDIVHTVEAAVDHALVILPDFVPLSTVEMTQLGDFVRDGGRLVVTGQSGLLDEHGVVATDANLGDVLGLAAMMPSNEAFTYLRRADASVWEGIPDQPVLAAGTPVVCELAGARPLATAIGPERALSLGTLNGEGGPHPSANRSFPGLTLHEYGSGLAAYSAVPLDGRGYEGIWQRHLMWNLIDVMIGSRWLRTSASSGVEVVLNRLGDRHVLHLVDHRVGDPSYGSPAGTDVPAGVTVRLDRSRFRITNAVRLPDRTELDVRDDDEACVVTLPSFRTSIVVELT